MKGVVRDLVVFATICVVAWGLMHARLHNRLIEKRRAELVYTVDVDDELANRLVAQLEKEGVINGVPRTLMLGKNGGVWELLVVAEPSVVANPQVRAMLEKGFHSICAATFPGDLAMVKLTDQYLQSFYLAVEPTQF